MTDEPSKQERKATLDKLFQISNAFYLAAMGAGCHAFLEFCGLMNEFLQAASDLEKKDDGSWMHRNVHSGEHLPLPDYRKAYIREKLECIYGPELFGPLPKPKAKPEPIAAMEQELVAVFVTLVSEQENIAPALHAAVHALDAGLSSLPEGKQRKYLALQQKRSVDVHARTTARCDHTSADTKNGALANGLALLKAMAPAFMRSMQKEGDTTPPS